MLREGGPPDVLTYIDAALLVDLWDELVLPLAVRKAWNSVATHDTSGTLRRERGTRQGTLETEGIR